MTAAVISLDMHRAAVVKETRGTRMQDGFIAIPNSVEDALLRSPLTRTQERVFRAVMRKTIGFGKDTDCIATSQLASMTGIDEADVRRAINDLIDFGMLIRGRRTAVGSHFTPGFQVEKWQFQSKTQTGEIPLNSPLNRGKSPEQTGEIPPHNRQLQQTYEEAKASLSVTKVPIPSSRIDCPHQEIIALYHEVLPECAEVQVWNESRSRMMRARWNEQLKAKRYATKEEGLNFWKRYFGYVAKSAYLTGKVNGTNGRPPFIADLEWIIRPNNFAKIVEGKYHHGEGGQ